MAAAMLCPVGGTGTQSELRVAGHAAGHDSMEHGHNHADGHDHGAAATGGDGHAGQDHADKCNLCSAFCSLTPLMSSAPTLAEPLDVSVKFSALSAPPPNFFSDGQERPPRTI